MSIEGRAAVPDEEFAAGFAFAVDLYPILPQRFTRGRLQEVLGRDRGE